VPRCRPRSLPPGWGVWNIGADRLQRPPAGSAGILGGMRTSLPVMGRPAASAPAAAPGRTPATHGSQPGGRGECFTRGDTGNPPSSTAVSPCPRCGDPTPRPLRYKPPAARPRLPGRPPTLLKESSPNPAIGALQPRRQEHATRPSRAPAFSTVSSRGTPPASIDARPAGPTPARTESPSGLSPLSLRACLRRVRQPRVGGDFASATFTPQPRAAQNQRETCFFRVSTKNNHESFCRAGPAW